MRLQALPSLGNGHLHSERNTFHAHRASTAAGHQRPRSGHGDSRRQVGDRVCCADRAGSFCLDVRCHVFAARCFSRTFRRKNPAPWQHTALIAWTGMRGADSLAGALAIPFVLPNGEPFPGRDLILLLTFCVIFATLVLQGLTLTPLVRWLGIMDDHITEKEERLARLKANEAALARLEAIESSHRARPKTVERLRSEYNDRIRQLRREAPHEESVSACSRRTLRNWRAKRCKQNATPSFNCATKRPSTTRPCVVSNVISIWPKPASNAPPKDGD